MNIQAKLTLTDQKVAIVCGRFNEFIVSKLLEGARDSLIRHGLNEDLITTIWVPGAFEIPHTLNLLADQKRYQGMIALGCVIRGATPHFDYVCSEVAKGVSRVGLDHRLPISFGILTTDNIEQAIERAGTKAGNKGAESAVGLIEMMNLTSLLKEY